MEQLLIFRLYQLQLQGYGVGQEIQKKKLELFYG